MRDGSGFMCHTSYFRITISLCGLTVRSAGVISLALHPSEPPMLWNIANQTDGVEQQNRSAQLIIVDTVRHIAEEYSHQGDHSRGVVSTWACITIVASISMLIACLCSYPMMPHSLQLILWTVRSKARGAWQALPSSCPHRPHPRASPRPHAAGLTNDRLTRLCAGAGAPPTPPPAEGGDREAARGEEHAGPPPCPQEAEGLDTRVEAAACG
ncbi:unnamed protein product [Prorocentrum cordatum]|uniref:Uncharacterized protein n=1 Tax=Prorocentrum cordatum TaxID=2364126 RepID=A0ABN9PNJ3_9DINO|nr:unnamed protein product [Polarella glacialis]